MAINKRKVLDAARKLAQKGAKEKALKEYNRLVQADPRDARLLLEIGDAYRRWGQAEEAIAQYTKVSNQYKQDGFDARAVAVLRQILNLDPKRYTAHVSLAELYQRMGLDSEAVSALQTAADGYYRDGRRREALELLRKMASLDPSNTTSRLKVADLLRQEGMKPDAVTEYEAVAAELVRQGATEQAVVVQERILELQPDRVDVLVALAQGHCDLGHPQRAEPFAMSAIERAPDPDHFELLCGIYKSLGDDMRLAEVTRDLAAYHRARGDESRAREVLQRLPAESVLAAGGIGGDVSEADEDALLDDDELLDDEFLMSDEELAAPLDEPRLDDALAAGLEAESDEADGDDESEDPLPEGDPDQLFAEASVYLRYGKREQAIASLKAVLQQQPAHRGALEKLGEAHAESGDEQAAVASWLQAAAAARAENDADGYGILRDRIATLDAAAAEGLEPLDAGEGEAHDDDDDSGFELDLDVSEDRASPATAAPSRGAAAVPASQHDLDLDVDIAFDDEASAASQASAAGAVSEGFDLDLGDDVEDGVGAQLGTAAAADDAVGMELDVEMGDEAADEAFEIDVDLDEGTGLGARQAAAPARGQVEVTEPDAAGAAGNGQSTMSAAKIKEDLEEAEFYLQQGLDDEAEAVYRRVLGIAPDHPSALLKLGELVAARGEDPSTVARPAPAAAAAGVLELPLDDDLDLEAAFDEAADEEAGAADAASGPSLDDESEQEEQDDVASLIAAAEAAVDESEVAEEPASGFEDFEDLIGEDSTEVEAVGPMPSTTLGEFDPEPVRAEPELGDDTLPIGDDADGDERTARIEPLVTPVSAAEESDEDRFDLREALSGIFEGAGEAADDVNATSQSRRSSVEDGFESIFADFKKGVSATLDAGDFDTRFDLGIAYREMGLFDDAIAEFKVCLDSPTRRFESLHMMGLCAFELGRPGDAVNHFEQALSTPGLDSSRQAGVYFDLGRAQRATGDLERARSAFDTVRKLDAAFPGLAQQIELLESGGGGGPLLLEQEAEQYESFDDLLGGGDEAGDDDAPAEEAETFESFDDFITEVEAVMDREEEVLLEDPPEPEPAVEPKRARKRKKISFV